MNFRDLLPSIRTQATSLLVAATFAGPATLAQQATGESAAGETPEAAAATTDETPADPAAAAATRGEPLPELALMVAQELAGLPVNQPEIGQKYALAFDYLLPRIDASGSSDHADAVELLQAISLRAAQPGNEANHEACTAALRDSLALELPIPATMQALRILALTGDDRAVAAIAGCLGHESPRLREEARAALTTIGSEAAADAIAAAIPGQADPGLLAGLMHSLGRIGRAGDSELLLPFLASEDARLRETAIEALAGIGGEPAFEALTPLLFQGDGEERKPDPFVATRLLQLADRTRARGESTLASEAYTSLLAPEITAPVRSAALVGQVACTPQGALDTLRTHLAGEDAVMRRAAIRAAAELDAGSGVVDLLREFATMTENPVATTAILRHLADRNAPEALAEIRVMATEGGPDIAPEAIAILGRIGEAGDLDLLLSLAAAGTEPMASVARDAIGRFRGSDEIETTLKNHIADASAGAAMRAEAIRAAGNRSHRALLEPILPLLSSPEAAVAAASYQAVSQLAGPGDIPGLVAGLREPGSPAFPRLRVILQKLCQETDNPGDASTSIIAATTDAATETVSVGLGLLAVLGTDAGLSHVNGFLGSENPELRTAAIRALSEWSRFTPADKLLEMLQASEYSEQEKSQLVTGIARLARSPEVAPFEERLRLALDALPAATTANDARRLISSLATLPSMETAELLEELLQREDVAKEAAAAAIQVAGNLPDDPAAKARRAVLLQKALEVPGLPDSLKEKAQAAQDKP